jgi:hypothetical protein
MTVFPSFPPISGFHDDRLAAEFFSAYSEARLGTNVR